MKTETALAQCKEREKKKSVVTCKIAAAERCRTIQTGFDNLGLATGTNASRIFPVLCKRPSVKFYTTSQNISPVRECTSVYIGEAGTAQLLTCM